MVCLRCLVSTIFTNIVIFDLECFICYMVLIVKGKVS